MTKSVANKESKILAKGLKAYRHFDGSFSLKPGNFEIRDIGLARDDTEMMARAFISCLQVKMRQEEQLSVADICLPGPTFLSKLVCVPYGNSRSNICSAYTVRDGKLEARMNHDDTLSSIRQGNCRLTKIGLIYVRL